MIIKFMMFLQEASLVFFILTFGFIFAFVALCLFFIFLESLLLKYNLFVNERNIIRRTLSYIIGVRKSRLEKIIYTNYRIKSDLYFSLGVMAIINIPAFLIYFIIQVLLYYN